MTLEWWNKVRMSLKLVILAQRDTITLDPPFVPTVCQKLMTFNGMGGLGLLLLWSLTNSGLWPPTPNFYSSRSSLGPKLTTLTLHWLLVTSQLVLDRLSKLLKAYNLQNSRSEAHPLTPYLSEKKPSFGTLALCVSNQSVSIQASKYWCDIINPWLVY